MITNFRDLDSTIITLWKDCPRLGFWKAPDRRGKPCRLQRQAASLSAARSSRIHAGGPPWAPSRITTGRPSRFPLARAVSSPALTRSLMRTRSCFATVAMISITALLKIPQESTYCSVKLR